MTRTMQRKPAAAHDREHASDRHARRSPARRALFPRDGGHRSGGMAGRATAKPERSCAIARRWQVAAAAVACLLLCFSTSGFANSYSRGNYSCKGFKEAEQNYRSNPENIHARIGYAHCLLTKGEDSKALASFTI